MPMATATSSKIVAQGNVVVTTDFQSIIVFERSHSQIALLLRQRQSDRDIALSPDGTKWPMGIFDWLCLWDLSNGKRSTSRGHGKAGRNGTLSAHRRRQVWLPMAWTIICASGTWPPVRRWLKLSSSNHKGVKLPDNPKGPKTQFHSPPGRAKNAPLDSNLLRSRRARRVSRL